MKNLLFRLFKINTWKILLVNADRLNIAHVEKSVEHMPVKIILCDFIEDIKIIDTGIIAIKKREGEEDGSK